MSWVVLEKAAQISRLTGFGEDEELVRWHAVAESIHAEVMEKGWSQDNNIFIKRYSSETLDAAVLLIPLWDFYRLTIRPWPVRSMRSLRDRSCTMTSYPSRSKDVQGDENLFVVISEQYYYVLRHSARYVAFFDFDPES